MIKLHATILVIGTTSLAVIFTVTNPRSLPSIALFAIFALLYVVLVQVVVLLMFAAKKLLGVGWRTSTIRRVGFSVALLPVFLLLLQSVGQLTIRDSVLAVTLTVLLYIYSHRMLGKSPAAKDIS